MDTILRLAQGHSCDDVRRKPQGNNLLADGPHDTIPHRQPITPSTALARLTEATDRVKFLTRQSAAKDGLWDVTESALKTLRNQFNSRLSILRSLWYAEPFCLVTVGRWLSRMDREISNELNALDDHVWARATRTKCDQAWTTGGKDDDICPLRNGPHTVSEQKPYKGGTTTHRQSLQSYGEKP